MTAYTNLIRAHQLHQLHEQNPNGVFIMDVRHSLMDFCAGLAAYTESHIPDAHFFNMETDLSGEKSAHTGRHPLPDLDTLTEKLRARGLNTGTQVVVYDDAAGAMAGRAWWLLRQLGHASVAVLDGGLAAWQRAGFACTSHSSPARTGNFTRAAALNRTISADEIVTQLPLSTLTLVDARAPERYRGEVEPLDPVAGHIPTAHNQFMMNNVTDTGCFKSPEALRAQWQELLGDTILNSALNTVVHYCGSGVTACHNLLSMHIAGLDVSPTGAGIYAGSWSEWIADAKRPVITAAK